MRYNASIIKMDGTRFETTDYNIYLSKIMIPSLEAVYQTEEIPGSARRLPIYSQPVRGNIVLEFDFRGQDRPDFNLLRDEIFAVFFSKEPFYFIDHIQKGKRWLVSSKGYTPEEILYTGRVEVELEPYFAYAESVLTTMDSFSYDEDLWGYGMGLEYDEDKQQYVHTTSTFSIWNFGNQEVDVLESELTIILETLTATGTSLSIQNTTTGDTWTYTGTVAPGDQFFIGKDSDGELRYLLNGLSIVNDTNLRNVRLAPGENEFIISGLTGNFEISFDFRFLYA